MHLKNLRVAPPGGGGGWIYQQPQSGFWMKGITFEQLLGKIGQHRANMKYPAITPPFATLGEEVEDWICQRMSPKTQATKCDTGVRNRSSIHWHEVLGFLKSNIKWFLAGGEKVDQAEAERRAAICATCPMNVRMHGCGICMETLKSYREKIISSTTSADEKLSACGVCGCDLKSIVHLPLSALRKPELVFPKWCWQHEPQPADAQSTEQTPSSSASADPTPSQPPS